MLPPFAYSLNRWSYPNFLSCCRSLSFFLSLFLFLFSHIRYCDCRWNLSDVRQSKTRRQAALFGIVVGSEILSRSSEWFHHVLRFVIIYYQLRTFIAIFLYIKILIVAFIWFFDILSSSVMHWLKLSCVAVVFLVINTNDVIDIVLNFTAVGFISEFDDIAFELAQVKIIVWLMCYCVLNHCFLFHKSIHNVFLFFFSMFVSYFYSLLVG